MRLLPNEKAVPSCTRRDELRRARAAAPVLRLACPEASVVRVNLEFQENPLLACNGHRAGNGAGGGVCQLALSYLIKVRA